MATKVEEIIGQLQGSTYSFSTTLLSNKSIPVELKPITVKEQKILIVNGDTESYQDQVKALITLLKSCIKSSPCSVEDLTVQDFIWLILKLRIHSQGSSLSINVNCENCQNKTLNYPLDLNKHLVINYLEGLKNNQIKLDDEITAFLCLPKIKTLTKMSNSDTAIDLLASEIDYIEYKGEIVELTDKEKLTFLESMDTKFIKDFEAFDSANKFGVKLAFPFKCDKCNHEKTIEIEDNILSFF